MKSIILFDTAKYVVELDCIPFIPGTVEIKCKESINNALSILQLPFDKFIDVFLFAKSVAKKLCSSLNVHRCAMIAGVNNSDESPSIKIIPLHGLSAEWKPQVAGKLEFNETYQGYISSNNGPPLSKDLLDNLQNQIRQKLDDSDDKGISYAFYGDVNDTNLFAKLVRGEIPQWRIWEDKSHIAFLTPFPNTPGFSVVIPRKHLSSDIFSLEENDYIALLKASYHVAKLLIQSIPIAKSCGLIFEGFEIDYAHAKLIPIIGDLNAKCIDSDFCENYQGFISSKDGKMLNENEIEEFTKKIDLKH